MNVIGLRSTGNGILNWIANFRLTSNIFPHFFFLGYLLDNTIGLASDFSGTSDQQTVTFDNSDILYFTDKRTAFWFAPNWTPHFNRHYEIINRIIFLSLLICDSARKSTQHAQIKPGDRYSATLYMRQASHRKKKLNRAQNAGGHQKAMGEKTTNPQFAQIKLNLVLIYTPTCNNIMNRTQK